MDYITFVETYHDIAKEVADIKVAKIRAVRTIDCRVDLEFVKTVSVETALEKVYNCYDTDREGANGRATIKTFLSKVVQNCVVTELERAEKERRLANGQSWHPKPRKKRGAERQETSSENENPMLMKTDGHIMPNVNGKADDGLIFEPHTFKSYTSLGKREKQIEKLRRLIISKIRMLPESDQVLVECFMADQNNYIDLYIEHFGIENPNRPAIQVKKCKALAKLRDLLGGKKPDYRDFYVSSRNSYNDSSRSADYVPYTAEDGMLGYNEMRRRRAEITARLDSQMDYRKIADSIISYHEKVIL